MTEGKHEPTGEQGHPTAADDDKTTAIALTPQGAAADVRPQVMLLGSGELSRELAIALRHLGALVIAVDEYPHAPAHGVADQSLIIPMTSTDELAKVIQTKTNSVVISTSKMAEDCLNCLRKRYSNSRLPS